MEDLDVDVKSPFKSRLSNANKARGIWTSLVSGDDKASQDRALVRDQFGGKLPLSNEDLNTEQLKDAINVNFGEGEAQIRVRVGQILMNCYNRETVASFTLKDNDAIEFNEKERIEKELARHFNWLIKTGWEDGLYAMFHLAWEYGLMGTVFAVFRDAGDWAFQSYGLDQVKLQQQRRVSTKSVEIYMMQDQYTAADICAHLGPNEATSKANGWNTQLLRKCLDKLSSVDTTKTSGSLESYIEEVLDNALMYSNSKAKTINVIHSVIQEASGKYSYKIFTELAVTDKPGDDAEFLYTGDEEYDSSRNAIVMFVSETGPKNIQGIRGAGHRMHDIDAQMNRALSLALTDMFRAGGSMIEIADEEAYKELRYKRVGNDRIIGPKMKFVEKTSPNNSGPAVAAHELMGRAQQNVNGLQFQRGADATLQERTAAEIKMVGATQDVIRTVEDMFFYIPLGWTYQEVFRRITRPDIYTPESKQGRVALEFQKRLLASKIPQSIIDDGVESIHANGLTESLDAIPIEVLERTMQMLPLGPRTKMQRYILARIGGWRLAAELMPEGAPKTTVETKIAILEVNEFAKGQMVPVLPSEPHILHMLVHIEPIEGFQNLCVQKIEEKAPIDEIHAAILAFTALVDHIDKHFSAASEVTPKPPELPAIGLVLGNAKNSLKRVTSIGTALGKKHAEEEAQKEEQQQQAALQAQQASTVDKQSEEQAKIRSAYVDEQIKLAAAANDRKIAEEKAQVKMDATMISTVRKGQAQDQRISQQAIAETPLTINPPNPNNPQQ